MYEVEYIEEEAYAKMSTVEPWHLDRIDQRSSILDNMLYHPIGDGEGINIYILDTGMHT